MVDTEDELVYASEYRPETHWELDQHRTKGGAAIVTVANLSPAARELQQLLHGGHPPRGRYSGSGHHPGELRLTAGGRGSSTCMTC